MAFRPIRLPIPPASARSSFTIKEFKGVDKASGEDNFSPGRAIEMQNFIRSKVGQIQKRGGFNAKTHDLDIKWVNHWHGYRFEYIGKAVWYSETTNEAAENKTSTMTEDVQIDSAIGFEASGCYLILQRTAEDTYHISRFTLSNGALQVNTFELGIFALQGTVSTMSSRWVVSDTASDALDLIQELSKNAALSAVKEKYKYLEISQYVPVPVIVSNADPDGGGNLMQSPNLLSPYVQETFTVTEENCKRFQLSLQDIALCAVDSDNAIKIISAEEWMTEGTYWTTDESGYRVLTEVGAAALNTSIKVEEYKQTGGDEQQDYEWQAVNDIFVAGKKDFVNSQNGGVWIPSANIGIAPVEGEPNVRITYIRNYDEYREDLQKIFATANVTTYGVGGYKDRAFLSVGNRIYYSGMDDPLYFGELNYVEPCSADKSIVAMGGQGKYLYAVDDTGVTYAIGGTVLEDDSNTFLADAAFVILDHVQGEKPVGNILDVFGDEFCYLSEEGLVAIRHDDFYDKRYAQNRSRMLGNELKDKELCACRFGNFLVIGAGQKLYFLDEMQQTSLPDFKYSGKQYEIFPFSFSNEFVTALGGNDWHFQKVWVEKDKLYAYTGTHVLEYDPELSVDKVRGGETYPICAQWITPPFTLSSFYRKKNILQLSLRVGEVGSAVKVEYRVDGDTANKENEEWRLLRNYDGRFRVFDYGNINYGLWTYNCDIPKLQLIMNRRPSRKCYSIQFRFTNDTTDKLSLSDFGFTYETEGI